MQTRFRFRVLSAFGALVTALLLVVPSLGAQQGGTVTGRVIDASSGQPVAAVQVFISALDLGGLTQQNGRYLLQNVPAGTHTLSVSRIGYRTVEAQITIGGGQTVEQNFSVAEEALQLDAIIVTGTVGGTTRRSIGNAVTVIDAAAITAQVPITSMQQMLSARTPGLNFTRTTGVLGSGSSINIRGFSSILIGNQPLIYVDGIRVDNSFTLGATDYAGRWTADDAGGGGASALDDINPEDIESIEIIKGPAAATLYGTEASAGVIQIITKKGVVGAPEFTFTARVGENFMIHPANRIGAQWGCRAGRNAFGTPSGANRRGELCPEDELIKFNIYDYTAGRITDNNPAVITANPLGPRDLLSNGLTQSYNLSVNGGTETVRYFMAADWSDGTGVVDYNTQSRINLRTNVDVIFSGAFSVSFRAAYQEGETSYAQQHPDEGGIWTELVYAQSQHLINHPLNDSTATGGLAGDGLCPEDPVTMAITACNPAHAPIRGVRGDADGFFERDPRHYEGVVSLRDYSRFTTSITGQHTVGDWFNQRMIVGIDNSWTENSLLIPRSIGDPRFPFDGTSDGRIELQQPFSGSFSFDYSASGIYEPNSTFQFVTSVGVQYNRRNTQTLSNEGDVLPSPLFTNIQNTIDVDDPTHRIIEDKSLGFFVQEQIGFNGRLFITGAVRADDHSAFGENFARKYYPKLSGTWTVSEENFWGVDQINSLRVRTAWGQAGRQPNAFARFRQYETAAGPGGSPAVRLDEPGNLGVGPETSQEWEGGFDIAFLDDRVFGEFTYFKQWIQDVIVDADLAPSEGFQGDVQANLGSLENWGWEASLDFSILDSDAFGFNLRVSGDHSQNKITFLDPLADTDVNFKEGYFFPNVVFDYSDSARFDDPDPDSVYVSTFSNWCDFGDPLTPEGLGQGGPSVPCNVSGTELQELMIAPAFPTYTWSIAPTFRFLQNQLEVFALAEGSYGRWLADIDVDGRGTSEAASWVTASNGRQSQLFTDGNWLGARQARDERYTGRYNSDFWKLREIGARYQIPQSAVASLGIDRASISISATNIWTIWRRQWRDFQNIRIPDVETVSAFSNEPNFTFGGQLPGMAAYNINLRVSF